MPSVTDLYGGAITTSMPLGFIDASMLREVPDTQEVYVNSRDPERDEFHDGLGYNESIIVDLLQRVEEPGVVADEDALQFHLREIAQLNGSTDWELLREDSHGEQSARTCIMFETAYKWGKADQKEVVLSCIGLIRLKDVETDVLITVNVPLDAAKYPGETFEELSQKKNSLPPRVQAAYGILVKMVQDFTVRDKSLFA